MSSRWAEVQRRIRAAGVLEVLAPYQPTVAGSFPLGLDTGANDVDILCEIADAESFVDRVGRHFGCRPGFSVHTKADAAPPAVVCRFTLDGLAVEVFGQPRPVKEQRAYRHLVVERRLLAAAGPGAFDDLCALRARGLKTEPAFARCFGLAGDPYEALLRLGEWTDGQLAQLARRGGGLHEA